MNISPKTHLILFADDTTVLYAGDKNKPNTEVDINIELEKLNSWLIANKLQLNVKKDSGNVTTWHHTAPKHKTL